jgi:hypothetical protein
MRFNAAPGKKISLPISVAFGGLEEVGRRNFVFLMDIQADQRLKGVRVQVPVEIGLKNIKLELSASLTPSGAGPDVLVEAQLTNLGETALDLELTVFAPLQPRTSTTISGLLPGHQTVRRFVFPGAAGALKGQRVIVSLVDAEAGTRLNTSALVP